MYEYFKLKSQSSVEVQMYLFLSFFSDLDRFLCIVFCWQFKWCRLHWSTLERHVWTCYI